jgi:hypothetical protein
MSGSKTKIATAELTVTSAEVIAVHPELHHYTNLGGLRGIVENQTLWATHYQDLNDATEVIHLKKALITILSARFYSLLEKVQEHSPETRHAIEETGGLVESSHGVARDLIASLYKVTFEDAHEWALAPFITSFCSHPAGSYEQNNGLLSQWRGYAGSGGFAIVFDTYGLATMLGQEFDSYYYPHINLLPATYATDDVDVAAMLPDFLQKCDELIAGIIDRRPIQDAMEVLFTPLVSTATSYKHQGFIEEREVRIVALPGTRPLLDQVRREYPEHRDVPLKKISTFEKADGRQKRYIALFDKRSEALPIKRIILGPGSIQVGYRDLVQKLVGSSVPVVSSETPFIG